MQGRFLAIVVVMSLITTMIIIPSQIGAVVGLSENDVEKEMESSKGVVFGLVLHPDEAKISIVATNPSKEFVNSYLTIKTDGARIYEYNLNLSEKETWEESIALNGGLDVTRSNHTVTVSTVGSSTALEFEKVVDQNSQSNVSQPYISSLDIMNGTIDGEPSAVAKVTVSNPSIQTYPLKLMVHTLDTDGSFYPASVRPGENRTITVELLDERGSQIAGEVRLYAGNLSEGDGAMDQVGFVGRAGEDTRAWNETYEPIEGPWRNDGYQYHNATYEDNTSLAERLSGGHEIFGISIIYVATGLLIGLALIRRKR